MHAKNLSKPMTLRSGASWVVWCLMGWFMIIGAVHRRTPGILEYFFGAEAKLRYEQMSPFK